MPRPKLSSLSSLLPAKGEATRPEAVARAVNIDQSDMQASEQAGMQEIMPPKKQADTQPNKQPGAAILQALGHKEGSRSAVSFRMTEGLQERLRLYAFETRRSKQDVLDDALHEYLERAGR